MTAATRLEQTIRATIPLSEAMQFSIESLSLDSIRVRAPLEPNVNIHGTGFAGSIYSLAVLTGWALCMHIMEELGIDARLVVAKAEIRYRAPVTTALDCRCCSTSAQRESFSRGIREHNKGIMVLEIAVGEHPSAVLQATYCAIGT